MVNQFGRMVFSMALVAFFTLFVVSPVQAAKGGNGGGKPGGEEPPLTNNGCTGVFPAMAYTKVVYGKRGRMVGMKLFLADSDAVCEVEVFENEVGINNLSFVYDGTTGDGTLAWSQYRDDGERAQNGRAVVKVAEFSTSNVGDETHLNDPLLPMVSFRAEEGGSIHDVDVSFDRQRVVWIYQLGSISWGPEDYYVFSTTVDNGFCGPSDCYEHAHRSHPQGFYDVAWSRTLPGVYYIQADFVDPESIYSIWFEEVPVLTADVNYSLNELTVFGTEEDADLVVVGERAGLDGTDGPVILNCYMSDGTACGGFTPFEGAASQSWTADKKLLLQKRLPPEQGGGTTPAIWQVDPFDSLDEGVVLRADGGPVDAAY